MNRMLLLVPMGLLPLVAPVNAAIIYDNVSASTGAVSAGDAGVTSTGSGPLGNSFSTGPSASKLVDVKLLMSADNSSDSGTCTVSLLSDSSTHPGSLIATLGTINDSALPTSPTESVIDLPINAAINLAPNTRYWIEIGGTNTSANWSYDVTNVGVGVANEVNYYGGNVSDNNSFTPYQMTVTTNPVPEPAALTLIAFGAVALASRRRG
jgi:hypothetical protein